MELILVDGHDRPVGVMEKMEVHRQALLHRAFSIFIFNSKGEMLLQKRAAVKYHSPGLWTNACCSHPAPGQTTEEAAQKRLQEEMGFSIPLQKAFSFIYKAEFDNGLTEHEFDHVFTGIYDGAVSPAPEEVSDYCYRNMDTIRNAMANDPDAYTAWFRIAFPKLEIYLSQNNGSSSA